MKLLSLSPKPKKGNGGEKGREKYLYHIILLFLVLEGLDYSPYGSFPFFIYWPGPLL